MIEIDLQFKGIDGSSVVWELHEESVVLLKALGVCQGGGRLRKIVEIVQALFPLKIVTNVSQSPNTIHPLVEMTKKCL